MEFIALIWGIALVWSLVTGQARSIGGTVTRREQPLRYWISVAIYVAFTWLFLAIGLMR